MRLNKLFFQLAFCTSVAILTSTLSAQGFMKNLGTRGFEMSMEMTPTSDGNYVTVGPVTRRPGIDLAPGLDIYLNKVTPGGGLIWSRQIIEVSQSGPGRSFPRSVTETFNAAGESTGFAVTGALFNGRKSRSETPIFIATTDVDGFPTGYNTYGGPLATPNIPIVSGWGVQIIQTPKGELAVCGSVNLADRVGRVPFILVAQEDLNLRFLRVYHDLRFFNPDENLFGFDMKGHFADIEVIRESESTNGTDPGGIDIGGVDIGDVNPGGVDTGDIDVTVGGTNQPEGFVVVGTTSRVRDAYTEIIVMRTDMDGNPLNVGLYGPRQIPSRGTALTVTSNGDLEVAGLIMHGGGLPSTTVLNIDSATLMQLDSDEYYGFLTLGDIRELSNGDFLLSGREGYSSGRDAALLRIRPDGTIVFANAYGGPHVEAFWDAHELRNGDLYASGLTTTWCSGPADEYLVRTRADGSVPGCPVSPLNVDHAELSELERSTVMRLLDLNEVVEHAKKEFPPKTVVRLICPRKLVIQAIPWDWFKRADFNRDQVVDISDSVATLERLFADGEPSVPEEAADANNDGTVDLSDAIHTLQYLYIGGERPAAPFETPGPDPKRADGNIFSVGELYLHLSQDMGADDLQTLRLLGFESDQ